jgi:diaminohydroxyphosphoribosylaminopyrimidine deaminase/5-amino-6-(5-phosphoribosylamino)uracil reductase
MSRSFQLPVTGHLWDVTVAPTLVFTTAESFTREAERVKILEAQGVEVISLPQLTPSAVCADLDQRGCLSVLWECGGTLAAEALKAGCIQKVWAFIAPKLIGGLQAPSPLGDLGLDRMDQAIPLDQITAHTFGPDWCLQGYIRSAIVKFC